MKIIDLLNKIANGEEAPKKIKYGTCVYQMVKCDEYEGEYSDYFDESIDEYLFTEDWKLTKYLNDEVEIIEDNKKIEKLNVDDIDYFTMNNKINEIIDVLNKGE